MNDREKLEEIKRVFADEEFYDADDGQKLELIDKILGIGYTTKEITSFMEISNFDEMDMNQQLDLLENKILRIGYTTKEDREDLEKIEKIMLGKNWRLWRRGKWSDVVQMEKLEIILKVLHYGESWNPKPTTFWLNEKDN